MKLIKEQDLTLDDIFKTAEEGVKTPPGPIVKPKVNQDGNKPKHDGDKPQPPKPDDDKPQPPKPSQDDANAATYQYRSKLISNAVECYQILQRAIISSNWDETAIQNAMIKYVFNNRAGTPEHQAMYIRILYLILSPSWESKYKNNKAAYNYWISRNYAVGSTYESLRSFKRPPINNFKDWFWGSAFDYTDWDFYDIKNYFKRIFKNVNPDKLYNDPSSAKLEFKDGVIKGYGEIHDMIIDMYNKKVFGPVGGSRKNVQFPGAKPKSK